MAKKYKYGGVCKYDGVEVRVMWKDIKSGVCMHGNCCPVALAIKRAIGRSGGICVSYCSIEIGKVKYKVTKKIRRFLSLFDEESGVRPFTFTLRGMPARE